MDRDSPHITARAVIFAGLDTAAIQHAHEDDANTG